MFGKQTRTRYATFSIQNSEAGDPKYTISEDGDMTVILTARIILGDGVHNHKESVHIRLLKVFDDYVRLTVDGKEESPRIGKIWHFPLKFEASDSAAAAQVDTTRWVRLVGVL